MKKYLSAVLALLLTVSSFSCSDKKEAIQSESQPSTETNSTEKSSLSDTSSDLSETVSSATSSTSATVTPSAVTSSSAKSTTATTAVTSSSSRTSKTSQTTSAKSKTTAVNKQNSNNSQNSEKKPSAPLLSIPSGNFSDDDFRYIDVNPNLIKDAAPPFEIHTEYVESLDFGSYSSPCNTPENINEYYDEQIESVQSKGEPEVLIDSLENERQEALEHVGEEFSGTILGFACDEKSAFFVVGYDEHKFNQSSFHSVSIFRYDYDTQELTELKHYESDLSSESYAERSEIRIDLAIVDGRLLMSLERNGTDILYEMDRESGEETVLLDNDSFSYDLNSGNQFLSYELNSGGNFVSVYEYLDDSIHYMQYFPSTGELFDVGSTDRTGYQFIHMFRDGSVGGATRNDDEGYVEFDWSDTSLTVYLENVSDTYIGENFACVVTSEKLPYSTNETLYYYNLDNMECCVMPFSGYSIHSTINGGIISLNRMYTDNVDDKILWIDPTTGAVLIVASGKFEYSDISDASTMNTFTNINSENYNDSSKEKYICWFTSE